MSRRPAESSSSERFQRRRTRKADPRLCNGAATKLPSGRARRRIRGKGGNREERKGGQGTHHLRETVKLGRERSLKPLVHRQVARATKCGQKESCKSVPGEERRERDLRFILEMHGRRPIHVAADKNLRRKTARFYSWTSVVRKRKGERERKRKRIAGRRETVK